MKRILLVLIAVPLLFAIAMPMASAFTMSEKVVVANDLVAIARTGAGGLTADQRINRINERLAYILGYEPLAARDIYLRRVGNSYAIMVGQSLLMTVTTSDARANGTTVSGLAREWLRNARMALPQARPTPGIPG